MMTQDEHATADKPLTPRQDRIEAAIDRVLRAGGTRTELRDLVYQYADLARVQGIAPERALVAMKGLVERSSVALNGSAAGDSAAERLALVVRWCMARYYRAD
ncbi:MAG: hypothetical protein ACJ8AD_05750 [Gemmatimonadaceae bacterium]